MWSSYLEYTLGHIFPNLMSHIVFKNLSNRSILFIGPPGIGRYASNPLNWKTAVSVTSLHYFAGMAVIFGLAIEIPILALTFIMTLIPFWWCCTKE